MLIQGPRPEPQLSVSHAGENPPHGGCLLNIHDTRSVRLLVLLHQRLMTGPGAISLVHLFHHAFLK
jgi:hypothetical protein